MTLGKREEIKETNLMFSESQGCAMPGLPSGNRAVFLKCPVDTAALLSFRDRLCACPHVWLFCSNHAGLRGSDSLFSELQRSLCFMDFL